jgi:antitoxin ParD1/3/4
MQSTQQLNITLPDEVAEVVKAKVAAGEYASESEVVQEGLRSLFARDQAFEKWLATDVAAAYDELKADPSKARSIEQVRATLAAEFQKV